MKIQCNNNDFKTHLAHCVILVKATKYAAFAELWKTFLDSQSFGLARGQHKPVRTSSSQSENIKKKHFDIIYKTFCWF